jgi:hypothetical protein
MKTSIQTIPHADDPEKSVVHWEYETEEGECIAGGYSDTIHNAQNDARIWLKGRRVVLYGERDGVVVEVDFRSDCVIIHVILDSGDYFVYDREEHGDILHTL